jgi:hypothetical protein
MKATDGNRRLDGETARIEITSAGAYHGLRITRKKIDGRAVDRMCPLMLGIVREDESSNEPLRTH